MSSLELESNGNSLPPMVDGRERAPVPSRAASATSVASVILTSEKKTLALLLKVVFFLEGTLNVTGQLFQVYLVAIVGWTPLMNSYLGMIKTVISVIIKPVAADVVDRAKFHKLTILMIGALLKMTQGICMITSTSFGVLMFSSVVEAMAGFGDSAKTAMTLGAVGKTRFHKKYAATNIMVKISGVISGTIVMTIVSNYAWPDVQNIFWSVVIVQVLTMVVLLQIPLHNEDGSETVDHRLARGRSVFHMAIPQSMRNLSAALLEEDSDDEDEDEDEGWQPVSRRNLMTDPSVLQPQGMARPEYTQIMTYRQMYSDPKRRRSLILLSLVFFTIHLVNRTTTPLLAQYMAINASDPKYGLPITAIVVLVNQVSRFLMTGFLSGGRATKIGYTNVLIFGSVALCLRLVLISILVKYYPNYWALGATQILDGISGACTNLMRDLYSHMLSRRTGHFNLNMALMGTAGEIGGFIGIFVGGAIATQFSYDAAFYVLAGGSLLPGVFAFFIVTPDLQKLD